MSEVLYTTKSLHNADSGHSAMPIHASIQAFLNWIDQVEIRRDASSPERRLTRRNISFTNGPYAEIKESIGKVSGGKHV